MWKDVHYKRLNDHILKLRQQNVINETSYMNYIGKDQDTMWQVCDENPSMCISISISNTHWYRKEKK